MRFATLARLEWRMALGDGALRWVLGTALLLLLFSTYNGWRWREVRLQTVDAVQLEAAERASTWQTDMDLHLAGQLDSSYERPDEPYFVYAFFPYYAATRPPPLSVLAVGQSDLHAYYAAGTMVTPNTLYHEEEIQNPAVLALGRFDPAFFLVVILPVLIIALAFDLLAEDRRTGRDRVLLLHAGSLAGILAARCLLRFGWLAAAVIVPLIVLLTAAGGAADGASRATLAFVALLVAAYMACWFALALLVNARGASATRNAVLLLAVWGAAALFAPAAIDGVARARHPVPAGALRPAEERRIMQSLSDSAALDRLARYETLDADPSPDIARETRWVAGIELRRDTVAARRAAERAIVSERQRTADRLAVLSPSLVVYRALESVAGASNRHAFTFEARTAEAVRARAAVARRNVLEGRPAARDQVQLLAASSFMHFAPEPGPHDDRHWFAVILLAALATVLAGAGYLRARRQ